jgi:Family of unknown function (DUF6361)
MYFASQIYKDTDLRPYSWFDVVDLFREHDTRDELAIGSVRDAFADMLFPGNGATQQIISEAIPELPGYIHERGLARQLNLNPKSTRRYRRFGVALTPTVVGRQIFYKLEHVSAWLERCRQPNGEVRGRRRRRSRRGTEPERV